jgi:large repetitive protein
MTRTRRTESGLTLIELVISIVLLSLLAGALSTVFVTSLNLSKTDKGRVAQSDDAQLISAYLVRDAQAAGGTNPSTAALDATLGVSKTDDAGCGGTTGLKLRFKWYDRFVDATGAQQKTAHVANYYLVGSQLQRTTCVGGALPSVPTVLANSVASVSAACDPACDAANPLPDTVSLTMTATPNPPAPGYQYTVSASLRPEGQTPPCSVLEDPTCPSDTGTTVPLLALGGGTCSGTNPLGVAVDGNTTAHIYGGVIIDAANSGNCPAMDFNGNPTYTSGGISILSPGTCSGCPFPTSSFTSQLLDPFADLVPPADTCGTGSNPSPTTINGVLHYPATTYPGALTINNTNVVFDTGTFVFCAGLTFNASSGSANFLSPTLTNAGSLNKVGVDNTSGFNAAGGAFLVQHLGYPYYFTYTGIDSVKKELTGVALVSGQGAIQFAVNDPVSPAASSGPGGVLFYVKGGTISKGGGASVALSPQTSGDYAGLLIWQRALDTTTPMSFQGNGPLNLNGTLYAPSIEVVLSGTVDTAVRSVIAQKVTFTGNHTVGIGVPPPPLAINSPATLPNWTVGVPYPSTTVTATGGSGSNAFSATGLPAGMSITAGGVLSGTPTAQGLFNATVIVTDSFRDVATQGYDFTINPGPSVNAGTLPNWTTGRTYPGTAVTGTGGTTPYAWSAANLPANMGIDPVTGVVSGVPSSTGTTTATITLTDFTGAAVTRNFTLTINAAPSVTGPGSLPNWTVNQPYPNQTMTRANGTTPFTWSASGLPPGLSITAAGVISGTPNSAGTFINVAVTVRDVAGASDTKNYTVTINPTPSIATGSLSNGEQGRPYSFTLTPSGGTPPYTWSLVNGAQNALPPGLSLNTNTGVISGTPTAAGAWTPKIIVTDASGAKGTPQVYDFTIAAPIGISGPATLSAWTIDRDYPATAIIATGGVSPLVWSATPAMPAGMSIDPGTGVVSGKPTASGTFPVTVTVTDAQGGTASKAYSIVINQNPAISTGSLPGGVQTVPYSTTVVATLGTPYAGGVYHWSVSGLPGGSGLNIGLTTGVLSGTPAVSGTFPIQITAQDSTGATASKSLTLTITPPPSLNSVSPNALAQGATSKNVTVSGANFAAGAAVSFSGGGIAVNSTTFVDSSTVIANVTIAGNAGVGLRNVTETNPDGSTGTFANAFTVNAAPTVASTNPASRGQGATNQDITITGTNFAGGAQVTFSGAGITVNSTIFVNATTLTANITIAAGAATGARNVTVLNSDAGTATKANGFTVNAGPTLASTTPNTRAQGLVNQSIAVNGTGFVSGATVSFSGTGITVNTTTFNTSTQITVSVTIAANAALGPRNVTVTNPDGGSATGAGAFTVDALPTITAITPNTRLNLTSGPETIDGTGFAPGATVTFTPAGATAPTAAAVVINGPGTQITFTVTVPQDLAPPHTYDVTVTNPDGGSVTLTGGFAVT